MSRMRCWSSCCSRCIRSASNAASIAIGSTACNNSRALAASTRGPPKVMPRGRPIIKVGFVQLIYRGALRIAGVGDAQPPPASPAGHHPRQECPATPAGLCASGTPVIIEGEWLLFALIFAPADIAFVMTFDHHLPCPDRLAMPVAPPCPPFDDRGAFLTFPV